MARGVEPLRAQASSGYLRVAKHAITVLPVLPLCPPEGGTAATDDDNDVRQNSSF